MIKRVLGGVLLLTGCATCPLPPTIIFPVDAAHLSNPVVLEANQEVAWYIDDVFRGKGSSFKQWLFEGDHKVNIRNAQGSSTLYLKVQESFPRGEIISLTGLKPGEKVLLPEGQFRLVVGNPSAKTQMLTQQTSQQVHPWEENLARRVQKLLDIPQAVALQSQKIQKQLVPNSRSFNILSLQSDGYDEVHSKLVYQGNHVLAYLDEQNTIEELKGVINVAIEFDNRIYDLNQQLFGQSSDVDDNNRVFLLFSDRLNKSKVAVGFFYAGDLLKRGQNNPESNEAEILYMGIPNAEDPNFSVNALKATACHEYQHLINFSNKTLPYLDDPDPPLESLAVNEGLSHLAEDLCGYNTWGGNLVFVSRFLDQPQLFSLDGISLKGQSDSIERRGAMYLYLRYLFEQVGGVVFKEGQLMDLGGARFLRSVVHAPKIGLQNVADQTGMGPDMLLWRWWWTLAVADLPESQRMQQPWNHYVSPLIAPETGDQRGVNLMKGEMVLPPDFKFRLQGTKALSIMPKQLPATGFALLDLQGPIEIQIPDAVEIQVLRIR